MAGERVPFRRCLKGSEEDKKLPFNGFFSAVLEIAESYLMSVLYIVDDFFSLSA